MSISAADVKALRDRTNAPMMECKGALTEAGGDMEKATDILRKKMKNIQVARGGRETAEGRIAVYVDEAKKIGAIVEMRCESAPVAKAEHFVQLANEVAKQVSLQNPASVEALLALSDSSGKTINDHVADVIGLIRENMKVQRLARTAITTAPSACWCWSRARRPTRRFCATCACTSPPATRCPPSRRTCRPP